MNGRMVKAMHSDIDTRHPRPVSHWLLTLFGALFCAGGTSMSVAHEMPPYDGYTVYNSITPPTPIVYTEPHDDLSVKVLGGKVTIRRSFADSTWQSNYNWTTLKFSYDSFDGSVKTVTRGRSEYTRHGVGVFQDKIHNTIRQTVTGFRWQDKLGNWIEYDLNGVIQSYGDRNNVRVSFTHEVITVTIPGGTTNNTLTYTRMTGVYDHVGTQVLWFEYAKPVPTDLTESLVAIRDASGRRVEYRYNANRQLSEVVDANGNTWLYGYTPITGSGTAAVRAALPIKFTDPEGRVILRSWFGNGELAKIRFTNGSDTDPGTGIDYRYEYDLSKNIYYIKETTTAGKITETWSNFDGDVVRKDLNGKTLETWAIAGRSFVKTDARGLVTTETRDALDNVIRIEYPDGSSVSTTYDPQYSNPLTHTDELGVVTKYDYDTRGNLTRLTEALGLPEQRITEYSYDQYGQRQTERRLGDANTQEALTQYDYDNKGNLIQVTDAENNITQYPAQDYDVMGNSKRKIDARGKVWTSTYDNRGKLLSVTDPLNHSTSSGYDRSGWRTSTTDAVGNVTRYSHDARGNVITVTDPYDGVTRFEYNDDNLRTKEIDQENRIIKTSEYDADGRPSRVIDGNGNVTQYVYGDEASGLNNLLTKVIYPTFTQEYKIDTRDRIVEVIDVLDTNIRQSTRFNFNAKSQMLSITDKENKTSSATYDALNRIKTVTDAATGLAEATYDARDNLLRLRDQKNKTHRFTYDRANRKQTELRPLNQALSYTYTATNLIETVTDAKGQIRKYNYDDAGRRIGESFYLTATDFTNNNPVKTINYSFSDINRLTGYSDGTTTGSTNYDPRQLRKVGESVNYGTFSLNYSYDYFTNGLKKSFTGPDGVPVNYTHDANNQLATVQLPTGNITVNSYKWTAPAQITLPGGTVRNHTHDPLLSVTQIQVKDAGQSEIMNYQYSYDNVGNIKTKNTEHGNYSYSYDDLYRLSTATNPGPLSSEAYTYDAVGNRETDSKTTGNWIYNDNHQLQSLDGISFEYDANGNTTRKIDSNNPTQTRNYVYDVQDRLIEVRDQNNALIATYTYDPFNRRIAKELAGSGAKTHFFYADEGLIAEADTNGAITKSYGYKPSNTWGADPLYLKEGANTYYFQNDHLGTSQKLITQNGNVVWSAKSEAFGITLVDPASTITNNLRFAGQYYDSETGLHYNWMRYYDPKLGRYLSSDPIMLADGFNTYAYVASNPLSLIDPWGLASTCYSQGPDCSPAGPPGGVFKQPPGGGCFSAKWGYGAITGWGPCGPKKPPQWPDGQSCAGPSSGGPGPSPDGPGPGPDPGNGPGGLPEGWEGCLGGLRGCIFGCERMLVRKVVSAATLGVIEFAAEEVAEARGYHRIAKAIKIGGALAWLYKSFTIPYDVTTCVRNCYQKCS